MTDDTPRWLRDAGQFGAGSPWPESGIGMPRTEIERRVAAIFNTVEDLAEASDRLHWVAYHEGGHVLVARAMGGTVRGVSIDERGHGETPVDWDQSAGDEWTVQGRAAVAVAGAIAERMYCDGSPGDGSDDDQAVMQELMSSEQPPDVLQAMRAAEQILLAQGDELDLLVDALVRRRRLDADELEAILGEADDYDDDDCIEQRDHAEFLRRMESRMRTGVAGPAPLLCSGGRIFKYEARG